MGPDQSFVTVAVIGICGAAHLRRCLSALGAQENAPPFETLVVYDPHFDDVTSLKGQYPDVELVANAGQRTPLELAARAMYFARGDIILLTEDHCVPNRDWVRRLVDAASVQGRAAAGGTVATSPDATATDWAFYFVDFFRYMPPVREGPSRTITVCNAAYRKEQLAAIAPLWQNIFHETAVNDALRQRFGPLWLEPSAGVLMRRNVRFRDAVYERYAFGRLFGCTRLKFGGSGRRIYYATLAPALPLLLLGRMAARVARSRAVCKRFLKSLPALTALVLAWSWGEWLGYLTRRMPASLVVAPEIRQRGRERASSS